MDEPKETQENPLQETETASTGSEGTTPTKEAKTQYTQEDIDKLLQADRIKRGRDDKSLADREATLSAQQETVKAGLAKIEEWERQQDAAELEAAKGDPGKMRTYQAKQTEKQRKQSLDEREAGINKRDADLTKREAESAGKVKAAEQHQLEMNLWEIAAKYDINPQALKDGVADLKLTTVEQAESLAKRLSTTAQRPAGGEVEGEKKTTTPVTVPTSGGTRTNLTIEQRDKQSMEDYAATRKKEEPDRFTV